MNVHRLCFVASVLLRLCFFLKNKLLRCNIVIRSPRSDSILKVSNATLVALLHIILLCKNMYFSNKSLWRNLK